MDSNHRRHSQQIYSLPHLATLVLARCIAAMFVSKKERKTGLKPATLSLEG